MQAIGRQPRRAPDGTPVHYERHRPEQTTPYHLVQQNAASFIAHTEASTGSEESRTLRPLKAAAISYRIVFRTRAGQKVLTLRGAMPRERTRLGIHEGVAPAAQLRPGSDVSAACPRLGLHVH